MSKRIYTPAGEAEVLFVKGAQVTVEFPDFRREEFDLSDCFMGSKQAQAVSYPEYIAVEYPDGTWQVDIGYSDSSAIVQGDLKGLTQAEAEAKAAELNAQTAAELRVWTASKGAQATFSVPDVVNSAAEATDLAIAWQHWMSEQNLSYGEMAEWSSYFEGLAQQFPEVAEEFAENAIISYPDEKTAQTDDCPDDDYDDGSGIAPEDVGAWANAINTQYGVSSADAVAVITGLGIEYVTYAEYPYRPTISRSDYEANKDALKSVEGGFEVSYQGKTAQCGAPVTKFTNGGREYSVACGTYEGGRVTLCDSCEAKAAAQFPQGWQGYPGDTCPHGTYTGGSGADYMCGYCEGGYEPDYTAKVAQNESAGTCMHCGSTRTAPRWTAVGWRAYCLDCGKYSNTDAYKTAQSGSNGNTIKAITTDPTTYLVRDKDGKELYRGKDIAEANRVHQDKKTASLDPRDDNYEDEAVGDSGGSCAWCGSDKTEVISKNMNGMYSCRCNSCDRTFSTDSVEKDAQVEPCPYCGKPNVADHSDECGMYPCLDSECGTACSGDCTGFDKFKSVVDGSDYQTWMSRLKTAQITSGYATCNACGREMSEGNGCGADFLETSDGKQVPRIPYGGNGEWADERCGDCFVTEGQFHHTGCDQAVCPVCGGQEAFCSCPIAAYLVAKMAQAYDIMAIVNEARMAGQVAADSLLARLESGPDAFTVVQRENPFDDTSPVTKSWGGMKDVCGFANINVRNGRDPLYQAMKKMCENAGGGGRMALRYRASAGYYGGGSIAIYDMTNSQYMSVNEAACKAALAVLQKYGLGEAYVETRID
jgi:hypothetical protein